MALKRLTPTIYTADLSSTIGFYVQKLGFNCVDNIPAWGWARVEMDDVEIMISTPNDHIPFERATFTGSFYFYTDNVDTLWEKFKIKAKVCYRLENFEYGMREFAIYDNNGYILQFGEELSAKS